jgi:rRNA maturation endonuclease Nob1
MKDKSFIVPGVYCRDCNKAITEAEYSSGECCVCGGEVVDESELAEIEAADVEYLYGEDR